MDVVLLNEISLNGRSTNKRSRDVYMQVDQLIICDGIFMDETTAFNAIHDVELEDMEEMHKGKKAYDKSLPYLIISDFKGILQGYLHMFRHREEIRDVIVVIGKDTPKTYVEYLEEREYTYIKLDTDAFDIKQVLEYFEMEYGIKKIRLEANSRLQKFLIDSGYVKDMYVLIDSIVSKNKVEGFDSSDYSKFTLLDAQVINREMILSHYEIN